MHFFCFSVGPFLGTKNCISRFAHHRSVGKRTRVTKKWHILIITVRSTEAVEEAKDEEDEEQQEVVAVVAVVGEEVVVVAVVAVVLRRIITRTRTEAAAEERGEEETKPTQNRRAIK